MRSGHSDTPPPRLELVDVTKRFGAFIAILLLSEDLDELVALSDRLVVMAAGKIVYSSPIDEIDRKLVGEKMASH